MDEKYSLGDSGNDSVEYFSADYSTARTRFRDAVAKAGGRLDVLPLDATGPEGERLTIDIGWFGSDSPERVLVHTSGLHGVEAFPGSAIQLQFLDELPETQQDTAFVIGHVLNPYGMAWLRRFNENSVDLNRNFLSEGEAYEGAPAAYPRFDSFLNPASSPSRDFFWLRAAYLIVRYGLPMLKESIVSGQYDYPQGLFFGGKKLEQGARLYQEWVQEHLGMAERVVALDIHTGLGKSGEDTLLVEEDAYERARGLFGDRVAPFDAHRGVAYEIFGGLHLMVPRVLPNARVDFVGQEFGTYNPIHVLHALREENRWHHHGGGDVSHPTKTALKEAFCRDQSSWKLKVLRRGRELIKQGVLALGG
jgi:hypothetical protein